VLLKPVANPPNPWDRSQIDYLDGDPQDEAPDARLQVFEDHTRKILSHNDSPDIGFRWSVNPYRGCFHACAYCYARPGHEYLSMGAGTDFDRKIVVKPDAPALLRDAFEKPSWRGETVVFSGVTDCYQPLEASYRLTRGCLEVCALYKNPVSIITKSPLIERDLDLLAELAAVTRLAVTVSIPFWDVKKARAIEPYVATPERRMRTIEKLAARGLNVGVNVAPVIPGLNDEEIGKVLEAAKNAGARRAGWVLLRLPGPVAPVFEARIHEALPLRAEKVLRRIRETRDGKLYDSRFGSRQRGEGVYAETIAALFQRTAAKLGLATHAERADSSLDVRDEEVTTFTRPAVHAGVAPPKDKRQLALF
jgi:DNA repair photolyase